LRREIALETQFMAEIKEYRGQPLIERNISKVKSEKTYIM